MPSQSIASLWGHGVDARVRDHAARNLQALVAAGGRHRGHEVVEAGAQRGQTVGGAVKRTLSSSSLGRGRLSQPLRFALGRHEPSKGFRQ